MMSDKKLIVGLGNPGKEYEWTRHNLGFMVVSQLAAEAGLHLKKSITSKGMLADGTIEGQDTILLMPLSFMNNSGSVVKRVCASKKIDPQNVLVICDDFSLVFGQIRIREQGSDGGHNGLASIIEHLGTKDFCRMRLGIGPVPAHKSRVDFVLEDFRLEAKKKLPDFLRSATAGCRAWLAEPLQTVMSRYNQKLQV